MSSTRCFRVLTLGLVLGLVLFAAPAKAIIMTFDIDQLGLGAAIPREYGDNVSALDNGAFHYLLGNGLTPNISVEYRMVYGIGAGLTIGDYLHYYDNGFGDLMAVAYPGSWTENTGEISFVPTAGYGVYLNSLDLAGWPAGVDHLDQPLIIYDEFYNVLLDLSTITIPGDGHLTVIPNIFHEGIVRLQFGSDYHVAIDNVSFDQAKVPDATGTLGLLGLAVACLGWIRARFARG